MSQQSLSKEYRRNERSFRAFINEARTGWLEIRTLNDTI